MRARDFVRACKCIPVYAPVFEIIKVPEWMEKHRVSVGERIIRHCGRQMLVRMEKGQRRVVDALCGGFSITASYLKFVGYEKINDIKLGGMYIVKIQW